MMQTVSSLPYDTPLTISNGSQVITWIKKHDPQSGFKFRRMHFKGKKLHRVSDNRKLGTSDDEELAFRLTSGFKRI
jgi:hypothetical protein